MTRILMCAGALVLLAACGDSRPVVGANGGSTTIGDVGPRTNTTAAGCAAQNLSRLTYANFAQAFFSDNCLRCHSGTKTGAARNGAPTDLNGQPLDFDTLADIQPLKVQIDEIAAMNPDLSIKNATMPPPFQLSPPLNMPSDSERQMLACWIAGGTLP
jgi:hypothetical protein